jgi:uncharacterized protein HemX
MEPRTRNETRQDRDPEFTPSRIARGGLAAALYAAGVIAALAIGAAFVASSQADAAGWFSSSERQHTRGSEDRHERFGLHASHGV